MPANEALRPKPNDSGSRATADGLHGDMEVPLANLNGILEPEMLRWFEIGLRRMPQPDLQNLLHGYSQFSRDPGTVAAIRAELERRKRRKRGR